MEQVTGQWQNKYAARIQEEHEQKRERDVNKLLNQRFKSKRLIVVYSTLIVIGIVLVAFAYILFGETTLVRQRYDNAELAQKITDLKLENESKKEQLAKLFDNKTLLAKAREIGLEKAGQEQIINVPVPQINQLSISLQAANAINYDKSSDNIDFQMIYKNLSDYFDRKSAVSASKHVDNSVTYSVKSANGILIRPAGQIDEEYVKQVKANALKAKESELAKKTATAQSEATETTVTTSTNVASPTTSPVESNSTN